jgi:hypothetical protein
VSKRVRVAITFDGLIVDGYRLRTDDQVAGFRIHLPASSEHLERRVP